ncbi:MAG: ABC transporter ATP-binding protein [Streptosporangiaceae bacterium]
MTTATRGAQVRFGSVSRTYRTGDGLPVLALSDVTLDISAGQSVAVTGRSGSGKSTLLHLAGAMDAADRGTITVGEVELSRLSDAQRAVFRRGIGFVFQRFHLLPSLTACDNVAAPVIPFRTAFDKRARAADLLARVGLAGRENDLPARLSGGQQQRVAIARALIGDPALLLADEPTGNLDSATGAEVLELMFSLRRDRGMTLILATHDPAVAARCDRVIWLSDGTVSSDQAGAGQRARTGQQAGPAGGLELA